MMCVLQIQKKLGTQKGILTGLVIICSRLTAILFMCRPRRDGALAASSTPVV